MTTGDSLAWLWFMDRCKVLGHDHASDDDRLTCLLATTAEARKASTAKGLQ